MEELVISPYFLSALFFTVALVYSSVGLGGGSSYTALMAILGVSHVAIPAISLTLNLFVTSVGSYNFIRKRHARLGLVAPFLVTSIPMSYLGGAIKLPKDIFYWILLVSLIFVSIRIYAWEHTSLRLDIGKAKKIIVSLMAGSVLGFIAGTVGIGGGIYLVPLIIILGLGSAKEAAACGAVFIWVNSLSGLIARFQYHSIDIFAFLPVIVAVLIGGYLGSFMGSSTLSSRAMEKCLGGIVIVAIAFLLKRTLLI
ncbi:MAG: sulfite exporter TauE/SafE family protein [Desulfobacterales bacterium]|nr:MAG: sulfite exporter TauE/SafE family protein [Desulfobacterales bacterium]